MDLVDIDFFLNSLEAAEEAEDQNKLAGSSNEGSSSNKSFLSQVFRKETTSTVDPEEDLTTELSSILSLTSVNQSQFPIEVPSASSSVLRNVLDDLSKNDNENKTEENGLNGEKLITDVDAKFDPPHDEKGTQLLPEQPVTFGSTMDEISDTELDSMLQEMDIDDNTVENDQLKSSANCAEVDDNTNEQASVEISEMKDMQLPSSSDQLEAHSPNCVDTTSYSSSESSSVGDGDDNESLGARPSRPTTLDIPQLNAHKYMYVNAGQTPPGAIAAVDSSVQQSEGAVGLQQTVEHDADVRHEVELKPDDDVRTVNAAVVLPDPNENIGKVPPIWVADHEAAACMQCGVKFTMIKRRHHCRACGKVLCSLCCSQKFKLDFVTSNNPPESRVCVQCFLVLTQRQQRAETTDHTATIVEGDGDVAAADLATVSPNPNNPMEYCSTIPPHRQVSDLPAQPPSVIVPVGVLKKDTSHSSNSSNSSKHTRKRKSVMFSDGIAPGSELATMEHQWGEAKHVKRGQQQLGADKSRNAAAGGAKPSTPGRVAPGGSNSSGDVSALGLMAQIFRGSLPSPAAEATAATASDSPKHLEAVSSASTSKADPSRSDSRCKRLPPSGCDKHGCFIPKGEHCLPPLYVQKDDSNCDFDYNEVENNYTLVQRLQQETLKFALHRNLFVLVKIVNLKCCMNRTVINFTTRGMHQIGNDEIIILLECKVPESKDDIAEPIIPKDIFIHLYDIYRDAELGQPIAELSYTSPKQSNFLGSREYGGFIFIRATFQCLQNVIVPENPFLIGILIHRYEVPWAKIFPLRLTLRLGAQFRYYPCPHISIRNRESVYAEIAQTIINFLADFRNYTYTLPYIRGLFIHMEDRQTTVLIPRNRNEDVIKAINNSSDHILAFGGNFSKTADGHLVCIQNVSDQHSEMYAYSTQAINIQGQPHKVTGASFIVLNEALKSTSGLSGKCSVVEDGLMVQIMPTKMDEVRTALRDQKDISIICGPLNADEPQTEVVKIKWVANDREFNIGVKSPIDERSMEGVPSMRVHAGFNYSNANYAIRLTDIYIIKYDDWYNAATHSYTNDMASNDVTRLAESIAKSASLALVPFLDLLAASGSVKIALRATLHQENVGYEAGTLGAKLPPLYMNALDNHLIPTLHSESSGIDSEIILELIFYILNT